MKWLVLPVALALVAAACVAPFGPTRPVSGEHFELPGLPFGKASSFAVDPVALDEIACAECEAAASEERAVDDALFFYGDLPLASVDELHRGGDTRSQLGQMFVSGYFGGLYLRDNLASIGAGSGSGGDSDTERDPFEEAVQSFIGGATHSALDSTIGGLLHTVRYGSPEAVQALSGLLAPVMALIHGYNRGYLQVAIENPPPGAAVPDPLSCTAFFSCRTSSLPIEALVELAPVAAELDEPTDPQRERLSGQLHAAGLDAVDGGRDVWEGLLGGADFDPSAYDAIIDLSYGFLQVTEVALLGVFEGAAGNASAGRSGVVAAAALLLWSGSYFLGLAADAPTDDLPQLTCADGA